MRDENKDNRYFNFIFYGTHSDDVDPVGFILEKIVIIFIYFKIMGIFF